LQTETTLSVEDRITWTAPKKNFIGHINVKPIGTFLAPLIESKYIETCIQKSPTITNDPEICPMNYEICFQNYKPFTELFYFYLSILCFHSKYSDFFT